MAELQEERIALLEEKVSFLQGACGTVVGLLLGLAITALWLTPQGCDSQADEKANPELPVLEPVARDGIGNAPGQRDVHPSGHELPRGPEGVSQAAKHPHAGSVAETNEGS